MTTLDVPTLWEAEYTVLCRFFQRQLGQDRGIADDLASETFEKAWRKRDLYREVPGGSPRSWLYRIARNTLTDYWRRRRQNTFPLESADGSFYVLRFDEIETREEMQAALDTLTPLQRAVIVGRFYEGLPQNDLLHLTTLGAVKNLRKRAISTLRKHLERVA